MKKNTLEESIIRNAPELFSDNKYKIISSREDQANFGTMTVVFCSPFAAFYVSWGRGELTVKVGHLDSLNDSSRGHFFLDDVLSFLRASGADFSTVCENKFFESRCELPLDVAVVSLKKKIICEGDLIRGFLEKCNLEDEKKLICFSKSKMDDFLVRASKRGKRKGEGKA